MRVFSAQKIPRPDLHFDLHQLDAGRAIDLEIGAGQGLHAIRYCQAHPERTLLAVEKTHARFARLRRRRESHSELTNLKIFHADAVAFSCHFLPDASVQKIFLLYPNPYPKAKQANLRWHNRPFLGLLANKLKIGGELVLATNLNWYAREAAERMVAQWPFHLLDFQEVDRHLPPRTHFERKYLERQEICWNLRFRKACINACGQVQ